MTKHRNTTKASPEQRLIIDRLSKMASNHSYGMAFIKMFAEDHGFRTKLSMNSVADLLRLEAMLKERGK